MIQFAKIQSKLKTYLQQDFNVETPVSVDRNFWNLRATRNIIILEFDDEFSTFVRVFCADHLANLPYPERLESLEVWNAPGSDVKDVDILLVIEYGVCST